MPKTKAKPEPYTATLLTMGRTYTAKGKTALEAIKTLKPDATKVHGVLVVEGEGMKREKVVNRNIMQRLYGESSSLGKEIALKQISTIFDV